MSAALWIIYNHGCRFWVYIYDYMEKIQDMAEISGRYAVKMCGWLDMNKRCQKSGNSLKCGFFCGFFKIKKNYGFSEV